jgi:aminoglycoside phosphotransferase (APT) family kinase protein
MIEDPDFMQRLARLLACAWTDATSIDIAELRPIVGGWSKRMFMLDVVLLRDGCNELRKLVLRINSPDESAILRNDRLTEHRLLGRLAQHTRLPAPRSLFVDSEGTFFGAQAMLLERLPGNPRISALAPGELELVAEHVVELMAVLHTTQPSLLNADGVLSDPHGWGVRTDSWDDYIDSSCEAWRQHYQDIAFDPLPIVYDAFLSLRRRKPRPLPLVVVHGELNPNNLITASGRISGLVDWERAHVGDPREDLAWFRYFEQAMSGTSLVRSVRRDGGFLGYYNRLTGFDVTEEELEYFTAFSHSDVSYGPYASIRRGLRGEHDDITKTYFLAEPIGAQTMLSRWLRYPA